MATNSLSGATSNFDDNILGNYANPTYHLRFYTIAESFNNAQNGTTFAPTFAGITTQDVTIAESGVTGYNIKSFVLKTIVSPSTTTRNTYAVSFTMVVNEPVGTSFLDALFAATTGLGIANPQKAVYYMDISFKGYNEDGSTNTNLCSNFGNSGVFTYPLLLSDVNANLDDQGSSYTITGIFASEEGLSPDMAKIPSAFTIQAINLGQFLDGLRDALNASIKARYQNQAMTNSAQQLYTYSFITIPTPNDHIDPRSFTFFNQDDPQHSFRSKGFLLSGRSNLTANLTAGQAIYDIIQTAISCTYEGQKYLINASGADKGDRGDGTYRAAGFFRLYPRVTRIAYDNDTQNYVSTIEYYIKMFKSQRTTLRTSEVINPVNAPKCVSDIQGYYGLRKKYEHIFTGLNTEVLEFNSRFHFTYQQILPYNDGFVANMDNIEHHAIYNPYYSQKDAIIAQDIAIDAGIQAQVAAGNGQQITTAQVGGTGGSSSVPSMNASTTTYVENIVDAAPTQNPFKVSMRQSGAFVKEATGSGFSARFDRRRSIFAALLTQIQGVTADMNAINLKIKGDPYWLGINYDQMLGITSASSSGTNTNSTTTNALSGGAVLADFTAGDQCFILHFKFPYTSDENGAPIMKDNESFCGLYSAVNIDHCFEDGIFTQFFENAYRVAVVTPQQAIALSNGQSISSSATTGNSALNL